MPKTLATICVVCSLVMCACAAPKKTLRVTPAATNDTTTTTGPPAAPAPVPSVPDTAAPIVTTTPPSTTLPPASEPTTTEPAHDARNSALDPDGNPWPSPADPDWSTWMAMANCETGQDWFTIKPRYQGGLGMYSGTWDSYGGNILGIDNAGDATIEEQIWVARRVRDRHGYTAWGCAGAIGVG